MSAAYRASYLKTTWLAFACALVSATLAAASIVTLSGLIRFAGVAVLSVATLTLLLVFAGGLIVLNRDRRQSQALPDIFDQLYNRTPISNDRGWRKIVRPLLGSALRAGDVVCVRDAVEIAGTLDRDGKLDDLPFMPEMLAFCGKQFVVDRRIDKVNDWIGGSELRRMRHVVTLSQVRCDGSSHGGCQAECQILWHERWLTRATKRSSESRAGAAAFENSLKHATRTHAANATADRYVCQITELLTASRPLRRFDIRQDLRPLLNGNIGLRGFLIAKLTAIFNHIQGLRGGSEFPRAAVQLDRGPTPSIDLRLEPGEWVEVRSLEEISATLHKNHNRGMWFGRETQRHCGQRYRVHSRIERIIHERTGQLIQMKTPVITLEGVTGTGEYLHFAPQNDYVFWREIWLKRSQPYDEPGQL